MVASVSPRPARFAKPDTFNMRLDAELKAKGIYWAQHQGSDLATEFRRFLIDKVAAFEKEHGPIKLPQE